MATARRKPGRLGPYVEGYRARLLELSYTPQTVRGLLKVLGQLDRWMVGRGVDVGELSTIVVEAFIEDRGKGGQRHVPTVRRFQVLLDLSRYTSSVGSSAYFDGTS